MADDLLNLCRELRDQMSEDGVDVSELDLVDWLACAGLSLVRAVDDSSARAYLEAIKND